MLICKVEECAKEANRPGSARGYCNMHYARLAKTGVFKKNRPKICSAAGCERKHSGHGWCSMHYSRWKKLGDAEATPPTEDIEGRFYRNIEVKDSHWLWIGPLSTTGYGVMGVREKYTQAHRLSYEMHVGELLPGLVIDHLCRTPRCVNPEHLEQVTQRVNALRGVGISARLALVTQCPQGHRYDDENTRWYQGRRYCKACQAARSSARTAARRVTRALASAT